MRGSGRTGGPPWRLVIVSALLGLILGLGFTLFAQPSAWFAVQAWLVQVGENLTGQSAALSPALATENARQSSLAAGMLAPNFTLPTLAGESVQLSDLHGRPVLINFWASWCAPCRVEMPDLIQAYTTHQAEGFVILAVNPTFQDTLPDAKAFVNEFNMTFPVLLDETSEVTNQLYHLRGLPTSVFVNRAGRITRIHLGAMTNQQITQFIGEILP